MPDMYGRPADLARNLDVHAIAILGGGDLALDEGNFHCHRAMRIST